MLMRSLALLAAGAAPAVVAAESQWDYTATFYGWAPGISTTVETPLGEVESDLDFEEVLETLDIAFLGAFEARKGRLALVADLQYFDIGVEAEPHTETAFSAAEVDQQLLLFSAYAGYAVVDSAETRFDVGGGLRYVGSNIDTHLEGQGAVPDAEYSLDGG